MCVLGCVDSVMVSSLEWEFGMLSSNSGWIHFHTNTFVDNELGHATSFVFWAKYFYFYMTISSNTCWDTNDWYSQKDIFLKPFKTIFVQNNRN